ncbi:gamma-glutamylcyclotransferase family protein [Microbacterium sulfonylureivorans]|uniref:gamma-glutamylcyclotransferase family protein n=1 Tax=Microbacterium sulfonylureivorans TaxID=2486854 RepID=UPI000FD9BDF0|nr:gamma-glutamylcyclotransferase [Microbacterium sulfonylureivorans]
MTFPPPTLPLFVYGSLRPGMALWSAISEHVLESRPAALDGRLFWHVGMEWPLLVVGDGATGVVRGELLSLAPGDAVNRVIVDEELLYGYDARWLPVTSDVGEVEALVLVWPRADELGPAIESGDYSVAVAAATSGSA